MTLRELHEVINQISFVQVLQLDEILSVGSDRGEQVSLLDTLADRGTDPTTGLEGQETRGMLAAAITLPKGTRLDVTLTYDNSADNPRNPISPPRRALWGEQSFDEMGTVGFGFEVLKKADVPSFQQALAARTKAAIAAGGKDGTVGRFLASQQRRSRGLQQLTVFDRQGTVVGRVGEPGAYSQAAFSPDGSRLAVIKRDLDTDTQDVWAFDVDTGKGTSISSDPALGYRTGVVS